MQQLIAMESGIPIQTNSRLYEDFKNNPPYGKGHPSQTLSRLPNFTIV